MLPTWSNCYLSNESYNCKFHTNTHRGLSMTTRTLCTQWVLAWDDEKDVWSCVPHYACQFSLLELSHAIPMLSPLNGRDVSRCEQASSRWQCFEDGSRLHEIGRPGVTSVGCFWRHFKTHEAGLRHVAACTLLYYTTYYDMVSPDRCVGVYTSMGLACWLNFIHPEWKSQKVQEGNNDIQ